MAQKNENDARCCGMLKNIPTPDSKNRITLPAYEWELFLEKNKIESRGEQKMIFVPTETAQSFWGMTIPQFEKLAQSICKKDRLFIDSIYRARSILKISKDRKTSPFTFLEKSGLLYFAKNERFQIACSLHEDFENAGYFLKFLPVVLEEIDQKFLPIVLPIRDRVKKVFGTEFSDFLAKMPR